MAKKEAETTKITKKTTTKTAAKLAKKAAGVVDLTQKNHDDLAPDITIEKKLESLYSLQLIDEKIDEIRIIRGDLPVEVKEMKDNIEGLETRISNFKKDIKFNNTEIVSFKNKIEEAKALIKRYEEQQMKVRNNREYDSLTKEIEYQTLDIELSEKRIKESQMLIESCKQEISLAEENIAQIKEDLVIKEEELENILNDVENKKEKELQKLSEEQASFIQEKYLYAYNRIRSNVNNGLAVVRIYEEACAGCYIIIPPQRQIDIQMHRKIYFCESCGRILVDNQFADEIKEKMEEKISQIID